MSLGFIHTFTLNIAETSGCSSELSHYQTNPIVQDDVPEQHLFLFISVQGACATSP